MAKKRSEEQQEAQSNQDVRNHQRPVWTSFDQCWASCVKNGDKILKESAKVHLKRIGMWNDQTKWIDGLIHFGIPIEK